MNETIVVERRGPYGIMAGGVWYNLDGGCEYAPDDFQVGGSYDVLIKESKTGKRYIQRVLNGGEPGGASAAPAPAPKPANPKPPAAYARAGMSQEDKDRIVRQGAYQAVLQSPLLPAFVLNKEDVVPVVSEIAEAIIAKVKGA